MDISIPIEINRNLERFRVFLKEHLSPDAPAWYRQGKVPVEFYRAMGKGGWFGFAIRRGRSKGNAGKKSKIVILQILPFLM
jgi:alkylation response protein AidB-like acyl-CoA dehydrogenase